MAEREDVDQTDGKRDGAFISTNLPTRPRGERDEYWNNGRTEGESLIEFLKYLEKEAEKDTKQSKSLMKLASEVPVDSILRSQRLNWGATAVPDSHVWTETDNSESCYLVDTFHCHEQKTPHHKRPRVRCTACGIVVHPGCVASVEKNSIVCKSTFRKAGQKLRELGQDQHQWMKFKKWNGRCKKCDKGFGIMAFGNKDFVATVCTWCKDAYHMNCYDAIVKAELCSFGSLQQSIVPPSWIVKLPLSISEHDGSRSRKATVRRSGRKKNFDDKASLFFTVKPTAYGRAQHLPLVVFINPRSGGNQGVKLLGAFQFLLNPRQVFDLSDGGPEFGLRMFARVNNLRVLVCGGDGTVGWVLSKLDELKEQTGIPSPPIAVLPLGTGNDLARTLGWGGGYTDEPIEKIIRHVEEGPVVLMDRWSLDIKRNTAVPGFQYEQAMGSDDAPLHVINNYFSIGADAAISLQFHESREANPAKFNNRLKNKMFYAQASSKDVMQRKFSDLCSHIRFFVDGEEITEKLRALKFEVLLVLNIINYAAGSVPWGTPPSQPQDLSDNLAEVLGLWSKTFPKLHLGGHGERIKQASEVKIITSRSLPIQIDGEACMLKPSVIVIRLKNQVHMIKKIRHQRGNRERSPNYSPFCTQDEIIKVSVETLAFDEYSHYKEDLYKANRHAKHLGLISMHASGTLSQVRKTIVERFGNGQLRSPWCFLDVAHHGKRDMLYRVEVGDEGSMAVADMSCDGLLIVDLPEDSSSEDDPTGIPRSRSTPGHPIVDLERERKVSAPFPELPPKDPSLFGNGQVVNERDSERRLSTMVLPDSEESSGGGLHQLVGVEVHRSNLPPPIPPTPAPAPAGEPVYPGQRPNLMSPGVDDVMTVVSDSSSGDLYFPSDDEEIPPTSPSDINHQLLDAAKKGQVSTVCELHLAGASLIFTDVDGLTALHNASRHGKKEVVRYLVQNMTTEALDLTEKIRQQTSLHKAAWYGYRTICVLLIEGGASLLPKDYQFYTPYQRSIQSEDTDLMKYLLDKEKQEKKRLKIVNATLSASNLLVASTGSDRSSSSPRLLEVSASPERMLGRLQKSSSTDSPPESMDSASQRSSSKVSEKSRSLGRTTT